MCMVPCGATPHAQNRLLCFCSLQLHTQRTWDERAAHGLNDDVTVERLADQPHIALEDARNLIEGGRGGGSEG